MQVQTPKFDPELEAALPALNAFVPATLTLAGAQALSAAAPPDPSVGGLVEALGLVVTDHAVVGHGGDAIELSVFRSTEVAPTAVLYHVHGGGMVSGNRFMGLEHYLSFADTHGVVIVSVEYRLAPQFPDPYPVEDAYAGLLWAAQHAIDLGLEDPRVIVAGASAGGGITAGMTLLARDRGAPEIRAQILQCPMLDDRNDTVSSHQFQGVGVWDRASNLMGWDGLLGERRGSEEVSIYAAPGRAHDLGGLPPTYIDVNSAEVFRDEDISYASRIWQAGGEATLHVWPGGFHGSEHAIPTARLSQRARATRDQWIRDLLEG